MEKQIIAYINAFKPEKNILDTAVFMAKSLEIPLQFHDVTVFPHVINSDRIHNEVTRVTSSREMMQAAEKKMDDLVSKVRRERWLYTTHSCQVGFPAEVLSDFTNQMLWDDQMLPPYLLIIENSSGRDWLNMIFGTVETAVAKLSEVPVLLVSDRQVSAFNKIIYVFKNGHIEMPEAMKTIRLASDLGIRLEFLLFSKPPSNTDTFELEAQSRELLNSAKSNNLDIQFSWADRSRSNESILEEVKKREGDILAFKHDNENYLESLMKQNSSRDLILKTDLSTLVY